MKQWLKTVLAAIIGFTASVPILEPELLQLGLSGIGLLAPKASPSRFADTDSANFYKTLPHASDTLAEEWIGPPKRRTDENGRKLSQEEEKALRIGAICRDGSVTDIDGGGACAGHGGVKRWLYKGEEEILQAWWAKSEQERMAFAPSRKAEAEEPYRLFWYFCVALLATLLLLALIRGVFK